MRGEPVWEDRTWKCTAGFRSDRGRLRRKAHICLWVALAFVYGILQVGLSTEVSRRSNRIEDLRARISIAETDLAVAQARLEGERVYGQLLAAAEEGGFEPTGPHRVLAASAVPTPEVDWAERLTDDLHRGSRLLLPEALAQDLWVEGSAGDGRP